MDFNSLISGMEFLDLSDANDDEKAEAMAIIGSGPLNGVEFPFEYKSITNEMISETHKSRTPSPLNNLTINADINISAVDSQALSSSPAIGLESCSSPSVCEFARVSTEPIPQSQWEMSVSSGGPVVCAPPPYALYHQAGAHYYATNAPMTGHYFNPVNGSINMGANKDVNKLRPSGSIVVNSNGKTGKTIQSADIQRQPFYQPNQYTEGPQLMDPSRGPPSTLVGDGMVTLANGPPVPQMFTPGFAHTFLPHPTPFAAPQMYLIQTPEGSYFTYGLPTPSIQMPRPSSPPSVPNVGNTDDISAKTSEVPSSDDNLTLPEDEVNDEMTEEDMTANTVNNTLIDNQNYSQNVEQIIESNAGELNVNNRNECNEYDFRNDSIPNNSNDTKIENPSQPTLSSNSSTSLTTTNTTNTNVWASGNSQRSWADLFKEQSSSASVHNSLITSSLSSNTSNVLSLAPINYNNMDSGNDLKLSGSVICESDAQIQSIPMRSDPFARKLSKRMREMSLKHSLPYLIPCGFVNRGNWCYINATLQALLACPPFYNLMREIGETAGIFRERSSTPIIDSFAKFFAHFIPSEHMTKKQKMGGNITSEDLPRGEPIEPRCIYEVLGSIKSECLKGRQEDAEEFLSSVLNGLHEEMIALFRLMSTDHEKKPLNGDHCTANGHITGKDENGDNYGDIEDHENDSVNDDDDANLWKEVGSRHKAMPTRSAKVISTPIFDIFGGSTLSVRTAGKDVCGNRQPYFALQLDIQSDKVKSVEDALKFLTTSESIQGYICPKTKQAMDASAQTFLDTLPPVLILHLKLFVYDMDGGCRKLMKRIEYPVDLELPRECLHYDRWEREKNVQLKRYKLLSVVYHDGAEAVKGHYVTDVYHIGSNQWIRCDDGSIKVIPTQRVLNTETSRTPYLLFYRRHDTLHGKNSALSNSKAFYH